MNSLPLLRCAPVAAALLLLTVRAGAEPPGPLTYVADVPLLDGPGGVPCLQVQVAEGTRALFGFDTGNPRSVVDTQVAKAAGLKLEPLPAYAPADVFKAGVPDLSVGGTALPVDQAFVADFVKSGLPAELGGTLGYLMFKDRVVQLDFPAHRIRITAPLTAPAMLPGRTDRWSAITFGPKGPPIVVARGFEVLGKTITAQVDTMYTGSIVIYDAAIGPLGLSDLSATTEQETFPLTDGGVRMRVVRVASESFHGLALGGDRPKLYFPTPGVHQPGARFDATVGLDLLRHVVLTIDFHDSLISLSAPAP